MVAFVMVTFLILRGLFSRVISGRACGLALVWVVSAVTGTGLPQHVIPVTLAWATKILLSGTF